jgi:chromosome segregation ATPase
MDQDLRQEVLDVRKVIEKSTSKVSLRDLEKKGFRQVKVLRAGDINQLIFKAVQNVLAKSGKTGGMSEEERQKIMREAKAELDRSMAEKRQIQQAHGNLQAKLQEVNASLVKEKQAFEAEKAAFARDKQSLMEKSLEGQRLSATNYEGQLNDLRQRLAAAEGGVSRDEHAAVRQRFKVQLDDMEADVERYRAKIRQLEEENAAETRARGQVSNLQEEVQRLEGVVNRLKAELSETAASSGVGAIDAGEMQQMRMQFEQSQSRMQDMMAGIANSLIAAKNNPVAAGAGPDMTKQFAKLQQNISDAVRKAAGGGGGGRGGDMDLTAEQAAALFSTMLEDTGPMETNMANVELKSQKAAGVSDKLAKLRNMRKR